MKYDMKIENSVLISYEGPVFGASEVECGNYRNLDVGAARIEARRYLDALNSQTVDFKYKESL